MRPLDVIPREGVESSLYLDEIFAQMLVVL